MIRVNLANRVNNMKLPKSAALLPVFEAIVNSFQALEDAGNPSDGFIRIEVQREKSLVEEGEVAERAPFDSFKILDNGIGFDDDNYDSFLTSDSDFKAKRGGKGIGRLLWLKAFDHVDVDSTFSESEKLFNRTFTFTRTSELDDDSKCQVDNGKRGTSITLCGFRADYASASPRTLDDLAQRIVEHCLGFFLGQHLPAVNLVEGERTISLNEFFDQYCADRAQSLTFKVKGEEFSLLGLRLVRVRDRDNAIILAAHGREVHETKLHRLVPSLRVRLQDDDLGEFTYVAFVRGTYLDEHVNSERTGFTFDTSAPEGSLDITITLDDIVRAAEEQVSEDLRPYIEQIDRAKEEVVREYVVTKAPRYRVLLNEQERSQTLRRIPPGADEGKLEAELNQILHEKTVKAKAGMKQAMEARPDGLDPAEYLEAMKVAIARYNEVGESALAEYVAHRKVIIDFLERALSRDPDSGKYSLEEVLHNLVFPMRTTSDEVDFDKHHLWLIDEKLAFHEYLASDIKLKKVQTLKNKSDKRPDIIVFNRALAYSEGDAPASSITVVEFKRPDRGDYANDNPVQQVLDLIDEIRKGHYKDEKRGREIKLTGPAVPAYAYIVCDLVEEMERVARSAGLMKTPDGLGYYGYISGYYAYVEVISWDKLHIDAMKRNKAFIDKLGIGNL